MLNTHPINFFNKNQLKAREQQKTVIDKVFENWSKYNYFIINAPTGVGKTYITCSIADVVSGRAYILTSTIQLQDQYQSSWDQIVNLKGRGNYNCNLNPNFTVDAAPCSASPELLQSCLQNKVCAYYNQRDTALKAHAMITNPLFLLYSAHCGFAKDDDKNPWVKREALIIDEAHNLEHHLVSFAESKINPIDLFNDHGAKVKDIKFTGDISEDYESLKKLFEALQMRAVEYKNKLDEEFPNKGNSGNSKAWAKGFDAKTAEKIKKLNVKIYALDKAIQPLKIFFNTHNSPDELFERWLFHTNVQDNTIQLSPINADFLFHEYFGSLAEKFVFMSATTGTKAQMCKTLGIKESECLYIEVDTPFPPEKSPIVVTPLINLTYNQKEKSLPKLGPLIDMILEEHQGQRGIIHCATYTFGSEIYRRVNNSSRNRLLFKDMDIIDSGLSGKTAKYTRGFKNSELLEMHANKEKEASVLVSPSMMEGVDLFDDLSEFQIILKMPWGSLGDPRIKKKMELDSNWYTNACWLHILQASGRSTRHENDESVTYILDETFPKNYAQWKKNLPSWFTKRVLLS